MKTSVKQDLYFPMITANNPCSGQEGPWGFQGDEAPRFQGSQHMKVVRLSTLRNGRLYPSGNIPGTHFCYRFSWTQGHGTAQRMMMIIIIVIICINCNWVVTRWQWLFYMYTKYEIGY